ncbi:hypothetical protein AAVH_31019, partial [Aphelenchoides avenae]
MAALLEVLSVVGAVFSSINIVLSGLIAPLLTHKKLHFHRNLKILIFGVHFAFLCISVGLLSICVSNLTAYVCIPPDYPSLLSPSVQCRVFIAAQIVLTHGLMLVQTTMFATCIERTYASTIVDYERSHYASLGAKIALFAVGDADQRPRAQRAYLQYAAALAMDLAYWW